MKQNLKLIGEMALLTLGGFLGFALLVLAYVTAITAPILLVMWAVKELFF